MAEDQSARTKRPIFLIVDDDAGVSTVVAGALQALEPELIIEARDGFAAQRLLREQHVDVVITDVRMPGMDGLELMRWAQAECPGPRWIVLSGVDTFDAAVTALQLGAFNFLSKPLVLAQLRVSVRNALDQSELEREQLRLTRELEYSNRRLAEKVGHLENLCVMLEEQSRVIHDDLARAEVIQRALLPQQSPQFESWCFETLYRPGHNVGGDYYDFAVLNDRHAGIVIADAAGHGVAAAMLAVLFKHRLQLVDGEHRALMPNEVLRRVNRSLHEARTAPGAFITAAYLLLDRRSGRVRIASAGHPPILWTSPGGEVRLLERTGPALGLEADARFTETSAELGPGDRLLLYTDGVLEGGPASPTHEDLARGLLDPDIDRAGLLDRFFAAATREGSHDPDDVTMILLERAAGVSHFDNRSGRTDARRPSPEAPGLRLLQGRAGSRGYLSIAGTGTWTRSSAFLDTATRLAKRSSSVTIDLGACEYLDSTFLGTLYEIVMTEPDKIRLQRVPGRIRGQFEELSMQAVLGHTSMVTEPLPPDMAPLTERPADPARQQQRLLRAHEILASLSEENQEQFRTVVESLRDETPIQ